MLCNCVRYKRSNSWSFLLNSFSLQSFIPLSGSAKHAKNWCIPEFRCHRHDVSSFAISFSAGDGDTTGQPFKGLNQGDCRPRPRRRLSNSCFIASSANASSQVLQCNHHAPPCDRISIHDSGPFIIWPSTTFSVTGAGRSSSSFGFEAEASSSNFLS